MAGPAKALALALLAFLTATVPAAADDASLLAAYNGHQPELEMAMEQFGAVGDDVLPDMATATELEALIDANDDMNRVLAVIARDIRAEVPSTRHGRRAKAAALREIALWRLGNAYENRAYAAEIAGRSADAERWWKRANRVFERYPRVLRRVRAAFDAAGLESPRDGVGAPK